MYEIKILNREAAPDVRAGDECACKMPGETRLRYAAVVEANSERVVLHIHGYDRLFF